MFIQLHLTDTCSFKFKICILHTILFPKKKILDIQCDDTIFKANAFAR